MKLKLVLFSFFVFVVMVSWNALADRDEHQGGGHHDITPVDNSTYQEECGSCHFAYQAGLLPERSWNTLLKQLDNHFGDNAELDNDALTQVKSYLRDNSADKSKNRLSRKLARSAKKLEAKGKTSLRISELPYFRHEHDEIPKRLVTGNKEVGSFSHCNKCHRNAEKGDFDDDNINIPGHGPWDD